MSEIKDGGSAFPIPLDDRAGAYPAEPGMTMRDYFATRALPLFYKTPELARDEWAYRTEAEERARENAAKDAYRMADAMLKARTA